MTLIWYPSTTGGYHLMERGSWSSVCGYVYPSKKGPGWKIYKDGIREEVYDTLEEAQAVALALAKLN